MQMHPAPGRDARVHHLLIQRVRELVAWRRRAVGPRLDAVGPDEPPLTGKRRISRFYPIGSLRDWRGDRSNGERAPRNTRSVEQRLVLMRTAGQGAARCTARRFVGTMSLSAAQLLPDASGLARCLEKLLVHQLVYHRDEKQRVSTRAIVDELRHACRKGDAASLAQIRGDGGCRQSFQHQLHTLCVRPQIGEESAQRMCAPKDFVRSVGAQDRACEPNHACAPCRPTTPASPDRSSANLRGRVRAGVPR